MSRCRASRNALSFSVSFTFCHPDRGTLLPHADFAGVGQEDDRDEAPYAVEGVRSVHGWDFIETYRDPSTVCPYVALVAFQIEPLAKRENGERE